MDRCREWMGGFMVKRAAERAGGQPVLVVDDLSFVRGRLAARVGSWLHSSVVGLAMSKNSVWLHAKPRVLMSGPPVQAVHRRALPLAGRGDDEGQTRKRAGRGLT